MPTASLNKLPKPNLNEENKRKKESLPFIVNLFDPTLVEHITIAYPRVGHEPIVFSVSEQSSLPDNEHPYMIIHRQDKCVAFGCTFASFSPHKAPMRMLITDPKRSGKSAMWDNDMRYATAVDLSRMASFPPGDLSKHFQTPAVTTATKKDAVLAGVLQIVLCHTALSGVYREEDGDALDEDADEYQMERCSLVIGDYEVSEDVEKD